MALTDDGKRHVQNYGEQHPAFHSKEMKEYRKGLKSEALKKKREPSEKQRRFGNYIKKHPPGTMKGDKKAMFEHNLHEYNKPEYD